MKWQNKSCIGHPAGQNNSTRIFFSTTPTNATVGLVMKHKTTKTQAETSCENNILPPFKMTC